MPTCEEPYKDQTRQPEQKYFGWHSIFYIFTQESLQKIFLNYNALLALNVNIYFVSDFDFFPCYEKVELA